MDKKQKTLMIGWDGATFDIIEPLIAQGQLPNIGALMAEGVKGRMSSTIPPLTPTAWTSLSTGVNPGKHGIFDAMQYSPEKQTIQFVNASLRKVKPIWTILTESGKNVGVVNVPVTYPVDQVAGPFISGMFTPDGATDFFHPPALKSEIEKKFGKYMIECRHEDNPMNYLTSIIETEIVHREKITSYLMENYDWDFFFTVFVASDRVQHFFWKYQDPSHPLHDSLGDAIATVYRKLDESLGRLVRRAGPETTIMMVSDHGAGPLHSAFFLNNWLIKNGYLHLRKDLFGAARPKSVAPILAKVKQKLKRYIPPFIAYRLKSFKKNSMDREISFFYNLIDWDKTVAFSEGVAGGIYIDTKVSKGDRYESLVKELTEGLMAVKHPSGEPVIQKIHKSRDVYSGKHTSKAPDLIVICKPGYQIISANEFFYFNKKFEDQLFFDHRWSGRHEQEGIFVAKGPGVAGGMELQGCQIVDISPTVLHLMNEQVPEFMDGRVLEEIFSGEDYQSNVIYSSMNIDQGGTKNALSSEDEQELVKRMQNLGYME